MKWITVILSLYIFALSVYPCGDACASDIETYYEHMTDTHEHSHSNEDGEEDDCSPFCSCDCCSIPLWEEYPVVVLPEPLSFFTLHTFHFKGEISQFENRHWSPPRTYPYSFL